MRPVEGRQGCFQVGVERREAPREHVSKGQTVRSVAKTCPSCGAPLQFKKGARACRCEYCGSEVLAVEFAFSLARAEEGSEPISAGADFIVEGSVLVKYVGRGGEVVVPERITEIAPQAFCDALVRAVDLPSSLERIGWSAFEGCCLLEGIDVPDGVTSIGSEAFSGCTSLESVRLPRGLTLIEDGTFEGCSSLEHIAIPEGVARLGWGAFSGCDSLESASLPSTINFIEDVEDAFCMCMSLERVSTCIDFADCDDDEIEHAFGDTPFLESVRRRLRRCVVCGDDAEPGSDTCEFC